MKLIIFIDDISMYLKDTEFLSKYINILPNLPSNIIDIQVLIYLNILKDNEENDTILIDENHYKHFINYLINDTVNISNLLKLLILLCCPPNYIPTIDVYDDYYTFFKNNNDNINNISLFYKLLYRLCYSCIYIKL